MNRKLPRFNLKIAALLQIAALGAVCLLGAGLARAQPAEPVTILVAYDSRTGNTEKMAHGVAEGVRSVDGAEAIVRRIAEVSKQQALQADGIVLGSPVHMADVSADMRRAMVRWGGDFGFFESRELQNKAGAVFATGAAPSHGKEFTMMSMALTMLQLGMVLVSPYGGLGASATTEFPESDKGVNEWELDQARELGQRVARLAALLKKRP